MKVGGTPSIKFCGAAGTVTGSCYLVSTGKTNLLIDCGMFQGSKTLKELNYGDFPFEPADIDIVLLTHAHVDHSGLIPKLIKRGFQGRVYATQGTRELLAYMLPDSGYIHEREVERLNQRNRQRGKKPVLPIYTREDGEQALERFSSVDYEIWQKVSVDVRARFWNAGHILGAASIEVEIARTDDAPEPMHLLFSGDIGPEHKLFHPDPLAPRGIDYLICESTYGNRVRDHVPPEERRDRLAAEILETLKKKAVVLIPAFAVERTQEVLADLSMLIARGQIPSVPVFLDSPLAIRATQVFDAHADELDDLDRHVDLTGNPNFHFTETVDESKSIHRCSGGMIVIAASGMCDAGRIRHHLKRYLPAPNTKVLLVGYQAPATLGNLLAAGVSAVRIQGEEIQIKADVKQFDIYSGHADHDGLVTWISGRLPVRKGVFLTHGETAAVSQLKEDLVGIGLSTENVFAPALDEQFDLARGKWIETVESPKRQIAREYGGKTDWHNELAQFSLELRAALDDAADEKRRSVIMRRVKRALEGEEN